MVSRGQTGQWGSEPFSAKESRRQQAAEWAASGGLRVAELDGESVGILVVGAAQAYVEPAEEPELYIRVLVTSRSKAGRDIGGALVRRAYEEARRAGVALVRVDCWAGAPRLVAWYQEQGFTRTETFAVGEWQGQLFERRLRPALAAQLDS